MRREIVPDPGFRLPPMWTHQAWCRYLKSIGQLAGQHARCVHMDHCVGNWGGWAYKETG
jgi:hypothetical protein